jgi:hypothetical protein
VKRIIYWTIALLVIVAAPVRGALVTFSFDGGTPTLGLGTPTPFAHTMGSVTAQFSSPTEWSGSPAYAVQSQNTTFYTLSMFQGKYLCDARHNLDTLQIRFDAPLDSVTLTFATMDLQDNSEVPSDFELTAYLNSTNNLVGSVTTHATYTVTDTFPQGTISFSSGGVPFNMIQLVLRSTTGTTDFLVDNITVNTIPTPEPPILAFYNNSSWDGGDGAANATDDNAIATDKTALLPGVKATFANCTSYDKGINGLMFDLLHGLPGTPTLNDFLFRYGNDNKPYGDNPNDPSDDWPWAPDPIAIAIRPGEGQAGADRVTLIWPDGVIRNCWLQVTVLATDATGLAKNEVFYVGNAVGESGNSITDALVNAIDEIGARNNPHSPFNPAPKDDPFDFNRDKLVNATDQIIARNNRTSPFTALKLITPPLEGP